MSALPVHPVDDRTPLVAAPAPRSTEDGLDLHDPWPDAAWVPVQPAATGGALADVIRLDSRRSSGHRHHLPRAVYRRRRLGVLASLVAVVAALILVVGGAADAGPATPPVSGHAVVEPGQTLWDVAAVEAPADTDPRTYLAELLALNGLDAATVPAWTVVLLPATD